MAAPLATAQITDARAAADFRRAAAMIDQAERLQEEAVAIVKRVDRGSRRASDLIGDHQLPEHATASNLRDWAEELESATIATRRAA